MKAKNLEIQIGGTMKNNDPDYIVKVEQAIAQKYGEEAIQNPKAEWDENKEKVYLEQMRNLYKKQKKNDEVNDKVEVNGIKVSRKLLNRESKTGCPVCGAFSHSARDDVSLVKFDCCYKCYIKWVEGREERWEQGWRPNEG
jgi:hypothetical protein